MSSSSSDPTFSADSTNASITVLYGEYFLPNIFLFCNEISRDKVFRVCKFWRKFYKWVNPRQSYIRCIHAGNFTLARQLFDWFGRDFSDDNTLLISITVGGELNSNILAMLDFEHIDPAVSNNAPILSASQYGHLSIVNKLLEKYPPVSSPVINLSCDPVTETDLLEAQCRAMYKFIFPTTEPIFPSTDTITDTIGNDLSENLHLYMPIVGRLHVTPATFENSPIGLASKNGHLDVVCRLLQDPRVDPSARNNYALKNAIKNGHLDVVFRLLEDQRIDPSAYDNEAIVLAVSAKKNRLEIVTRLLQDSRVDPSANCNKALRVALGPGELELIQLLLRNPKVKNSLHPDLTLILSIACHI